MNNNKNLEQRLREIAKINTIPKDHVTYLRKLKDSGFEPKVIYDIGACVLNWTTEAKIIWPDARIIVFDAFDKAIFLYEEQKLDYIVGVLTDLDNKIVSYYQNDWFPGGNSYYKEIGSPKSSEFFPESNYVVKTGYRLDSIIKKYNLPKPDLVKIDVQGSEIDIIRGGLETINNAKHLIVELQSSNYNQDAPLVTESLPWIEKQGWKCIAPLFCNNGPDGDYGFIKI
jgi:FkbM family methyltransferase